MKTQPAKLLMSLLLGMSSMAFITTSALAAPGDSSNASNNNGSGSSGGSGEEETSSTPSVTSVSSVKPRCTDQLITACGLKLVTTSCTGSTVPTSDRGHENEGDDSDHDSKDKDSNNKNDRDDNDDFHKDHMDRSQGAHKEGDGKISICHRMGGAEVSLTVANDGWASGHSKHLLDTVGRCADFDTEYGDSTKKDSDGKISLSDAGYSMHLTPNQIACLKGSSTSTFTINGVSYPGAGLNTSGSTVRPQVYGAGGPGSSSSSSSGSSSSGSSSGTSSTSTRGGSRTLH